MTAADWIGRDLGSRESSYDERDAILYALAIGASPDQLDLVFEERLRVLPTFALTLAQWAPDVLGTAGAFDVTRAVHGQQRLRVLQELPRAGTIRTHARVSDVWDKGSAAVFDVEVRSDAFVAVWSIFAPGAGGFGGERGVRRIEGAHGPAAWTAGTTTSRNQAALYRLLGDRHHIHIDPAAAARIGAERPILHGLCSLATSALVCAAAVGVHPADLRELQGRFVGQVLPGDELSVSGWRDGAFEVAGPSGPVIGDGYVAFG